MLDKLISCDVDFTDIILTNYLPTVYCACVSDLEEK